MFHGYALIDQLLCSSLARLYPILINDGDAIGQCQVAEGYLSFQLGEIDHLSSSLLLPLCHLSHFFFSYSSLSMPLAHIPIHRASVISSLRSLYASSSHSYHSLSRFHPRYLHSFSLSSALPDSSSRFPLKQSSSACHLARSSHNRYSTLSSISSTTVPIMTEKIDVCEAAAAGNLESIKTLGRVHLEAKNDRGWTPVKYTLFCIDPINCHT